MPEMQCLWSYLYVGHGVMVIVIGNEYGNPSSNLDEAVYILLHINIPEKAFNPITISPAMGK